MTDQDKVMKLANDERYFAQIYNEYKDYSLRFMRKMYNDDDLIKDIYQDATIVLFENSKKSNFTLRCSIQTYLNSICRNRLLTLRRNKVNTMVNADDFDPNINDWFEEFDVEKERRISQVEKSLEILKQNGEKCFEILKRFFYERQSMDEIALEMDYTNGDNVKNQKSRCQKKLKELLLESYDAI